MTTHRHHRVGWGWLEKSSTSGQIKAGPIKHIHGGVSGQALVPGFQLRTAGPTGMMVTARVADFGLAPRRSPFKRAAGEENFGPESRFTAILSGFEWCEPCSRSPLWEIDVHTWYPRHRMLAYVATYQPNLLENRRRLDGLNQRPVRVSAPVRRGAAP